mmetsp:Transcript_11688/g.32996  ORF Transcript_11688/g.32996 Transcript_11688/m.32996 type:complete len:241 (+) Transcript_11688:1611-2333(+)
MVPGDDDQTPGHRRAIRRCSLTQSLAHSLAHSLPRSLDTPSNHHRTHLPGQVLGLCVRLGSLDNADLLPLRVLVRRQPQPLRRVDLVHRRFHLGRRLDVRDQRLNDGVPKARHRLGQLCLDRQGNLLLGQKHLVQRDLRHLRAHLVKHVRHDLRARIGQLVKRVVQVLPLDLVLHRHLDVHKHVVLGLRLAPAVNLLNAQRHAPGDRLSKTTADAVEPGLRHALILAKLLNHLDRGLVCT